MSTTVIKHNLETAHRIIGVCWVKPEHVQNAKWCRFARVLTVPSSINVSLQRVFDEITIHIDDLNSEVAISVAAQIWARFRQLHRQLQSAAHTSDMLICGAVNFLYFGSGFLYHYINENTSEAQVDSKDVEPWEKLVQDCCMPCRGNASDPATITYVISICDDLIHEFDPL